MKRDEAAESPEALEARLEKRASEVGITIAPERRADVAAGAARLEAAAERLRRFLQDVAREAPPRP